MKACTACIRVAVLFLMPLAAFGATYTVTSSGDAVTAGTLRWALGSAHTNPGADTIAFTLGSPTIQPTGTLPAIAGPLTIDGATHPSYSGTPIVYLNGASNITDGLTITGSYVTVRGLKIGRFTDNGIYMTKGGFNIVEGCWIVSNYFRGIHVYDAANNILGSTNPALRNVIAGQDYQGIYIERPASTNNLIIGNLIGTDRSGTIAQPNGDAGIELYTCQRNRIGGTNRAERNVISGNYVGLSLNAEAHENQVLGNFIGTATNGISDLGNDVGIYIRGRTNFIGNATADGRNIISGNEVSGITLQYECKTNFIRGNFIGTDYTGTRACSNTVGLYLNSVSGNTIGGTSTNDRNLISGNVSCGIYFFGQSQSNAVFGNWIGLDSSGTNAVGSQTWGIRCEHSHNVIGCAGGGNVFGGNRTAGIWLASTNAHHCRIQGNLVGCDPTGSNAIPNGNGVEISGASDTLVGGAGSALRNLISGNSSYGIYVSGSQGTRNIITNNWVGMDAGGMLPLPNNTGIGIGTPSNIVIRNVASGNRHSGISLSGSSAHHNLVHGNMIGIGWDGSTAISNDLYGIDIWNGAHTIVGGTNAGDLNIIGNSGYAGLRLYGSNCVGNVIQGNWIGIDSGGMGIVPNQYGLLIESYAASNTIGGRGTWAGNVISGNREEGIYVRDGSHHNHIQGNRIGPSATGLIGRGNEGSGIYLEGCLYNQIGNPTGGCANIIADNGADGIRIAYQSHFNRVEGNLIGVDIQTNAMPNQNNGIVLYNGASNNWVGGINANYGNIIAHNGQDGIAIAYDCDGVVLLNNRIYQNVDLGIDLNADGVSANDDADPDLNANRTQNYPVLTAASNLGATIRITGYLNSRLSRPLRVDFFGSQNCDATGYGEGETQLDSFILTITNADYTSGFTNIVPLTIPPPNYITATATDTNSNDTSEFSLCLMLDTDGDGMADGYEYINFGGVTNGNPNGDADHDHSTNLEEFRAETDPWDADSCLALTSIVRDSGMQLRYGTTSINRYYTVWRAALGGITFAWYEVVFNIQGNGGEMEASHSSSDPALLYRVTTALP